jgi:hypothetical protein
LFYWAVVCGFSLDIGDIWLAMRRGSLLWRLPETTLNLVPLAFMGVQRAVPVTAEGLLPEVSAVVHEVLGNRPHVWLVHWLKTGQGSHPSGEVIDLTGRSQGVIAPLIRVFILLEPTGDRGVSEDLRFLVMKLVLVAFVPICTHDDVLICAVSTRMV